MVIRDRELTGALIASLINCYIRDNAAVDGIIAHLQDICPLLYSTDDAVCSKVSALPDFTAPKHSLRTVLKWGTLGSL